jgi:hypothetical protein
MTTRRWLRASLMGVSAWTALGLAHADLTPPPRASASPAAAPRAATTAVASGAAPSASPSGSAPRPPGSAGSSSPTGRPPPAPTSERDDPHANPHGAADPHGTDGESDDGDEASPHAHGAAKQGGRPDMFQPPEDGVSDDPSLPVGTLDMQIADPDGKPIPGATVTLGILNNSIAKGESRKRVVATANDHGVARFEHLETSSTFAYRPMVITDGATFSAMPFRLSERSGMKGILHVYPVVEEVGTALIVTQSILYSEVKDDRIQVQQAFKIYNFGKSAWVPKDLVIPLPEDFTAFTTQQGMTDIGVDAVPKRGAKIHGTFPPGQHMIEFRWQLPYSGESQVSFDVGMPPNMAASRVIAPASKDMKLDVAGFPPTQSTNDGQGQRALITEKQLRRDEAPLKSVSVSIKGLPTEGPAKIIATLLAASGLAFGLVLGTKKPPKRERKIERARLLADLADLERARLAGDVGPKTYEKARRDLLDEIARTFVGAPAAATTAPPKKTRARGT